MPWKCGATIPCMHAHVCTFVHVPVCVRVCLCIYHFNNNESDLYRAIVHLKYPHSTVHDHLVCTNTKYAWLCMNIHIHWGFFPASISKTSDHTSFEMEVFPGICSTQSYYRCQRQERMYLTCMVVKATMKSCQSVITKGKD